MAESDDETNPLFGVAPSIEYLQHLMQERPEKWDLIAEFSPWLLEKAAEQALHIFTFPHTRGDRLSTVRPDIVLDFLKLHASSTIALDFLESLIFEVRYSGLCSR